MSTRVKLDDIWPGPWPPLGTGPGVPTTNDPTAYDGYMQYKAWQRWKDSGPSRWAGHEVTLLWHSDPTIWSKAK